jgi:hypothetical protein
LADRRRERAQARQGTGIDPRSDEAHSLEGENSTADVDLPR